VTVHSKTHTDITAVYFPSYHRDPHYDQWYGPGWNEWQLMEEARPLFPGHEQPKLCEWGSFDEANPEWMARQIDLAADHGITSFLFDWYWYGGTRFLHRALEEGFLRAPNRNRLKFFIMWANHTWGVFPAMREKYRAAQTGRNLSRGQALAYDQTLLEIRHSQEDLQAVAEYCCEHYFNQPNYHKVDGKPIFSFWRWEELENQLGGVDGVAQGFEAMRKIARRHGHPGLHILINLACYEGPQTLHCWWPGLIERVKRAGADSVFGYNVARTHGYSQLTNESPLVPYREVIESHRELFRLCENRGLPFHPTATIGFDNTPRWHRGATLPLDFRSLFYEPIVINHSPAEYGRTLREAVASLERTGAPGHAQMVILNAWNEWSEGNYLLPDTRHGTGYLEEVRKVAQSLGAH